MLKGTLKKAIFCILLQRIATMTFKSAILTQLESCRLVRVRARGTAPASEHFLLLDIPRRYYCLNTACVFFTQIPLTRKIWQVVILDCSEVPPVLFYPPRVSSAGAVQMSRTCPFWVSTGFKEPALWCGTLGLHKHSAQVLCHDSCVMLEGRSCLQRGRAAGVGSRLN